LLSRSAHAHERNEGSEHFVRALANLVDARIPKHPLQWLVGKVSRAAIHLESIVHEQPQRFGSEDLQHRRFEHVILKAAVDQRRGDGGHRLHGVSAGGHAGDFLFDQLELAEGVAELAA
jgi:hypothetical protein